MEIDRRNHHHRTPFAFAGVAAVGLALAVPVFASTQAGPLVVSVTTSPNPYALEGTTSVSKSVGILGYATGTSGVALEGYATQPGSTGLEGFMDAKTGAAGNGVYGYSANGVGVYGVSPTSANPAVFGANTAGGAGVIGHSSALGVEGISLGTASSGYGVIGTDEATSAPAAVSYGGVLGTSTNNYGVIGTTAQSTASPAKNVAGVLGEDVSNPASAYNAGVEGTTQSGGGVFGQSTGDDGDGLVGMASSGNDADAIYGLSNTETEGALALFSFNGGEPIEVYTSASGSTGAAAAEVMSLDNKGDMILKGTLTQSGTPMSTARDAAGVEHRTYAAREADATIEDTGEARLVAGRADVALDPAFAALLAPGSTYLVFITPQGDTPGVYVAQKTMRGFSVAEHGGRSSIAFDYRIVGRPRESDVAPRLEAIRPRPVDRSLLAKAERYASMARTMPRLPAIRRPLDRPPAAVAPPRPVTPRG